MAEAVHGPPKKKTRITRKPDGNNLEFVGPQPFLAFLPDNVMLMVMSLLDIPSLLQLSQVNKRCYLLFTDEYIWSDVNLSTIPKLDVGKVKKIIRDRLSPRLWRLKLQSNAVECQRRHTLRPIITSAALDELFKKCPYVKIIYLHNCDLGQDYNDYDAHTMQFPESCLLWRSSTIQHVTFSSCIVPFKWMQTVKPHWPNLTHFSVPFTTKTSDHDLVYMSQQNDWKRSIRQINISHCYRLKLDGMKSLCCSFPSLHSLDISYCTNMTEDCLDLVVKHLKNLQNLNIAGSFEFPGVIERIRNLPNICMHLQNLVVSSRQLLLEDDNCSLWLHHKTVNIVIVW